MQMTTDFTYQATAVCKVAGLPEMCRMKADYQESKPARLIAACALHFIDVLMRIFGIHPFCIFHLKSQRATTGRVNVDPILPLALLRLCIRHYVDIIKFLIAFYFAR